MSSFYYKKDDLFSIINIFFYLILVNGQDRDRNKMYEIWKKDFRLILSSKNVICRKTITLSQCILYIEIPTGFCNFCAMPAVSDPGMNFNKSEHSKTGS